MNISTPLSERVAYNPKFFPFFEDAVGAIDGTHILVSPPIGERAAFRDRKGNLSQNVLAACNFDMKFTDLMTGWEGSVADSTLWVEGQRSGAVSIPEGKYVLGDAGFPNCDKCLTPYRAIRYHLQEWARGNKKPQNKEELFNLRHSQFRNVIERVFGVLKARFKILTVPRAFKMVAQVRVVAALCCLHNILVNIREWGEDEDIEGQTEEGSNEENGDDVVQASGQGYRITRKEQIQAGT